MADVPDRLEIQLPCLGYSRSISYLDIFQTHFDYGGVPSTVAATVQAILALFRAIHSPNDPPPWGLRLSITSALPLGAGLGSSAALSVSLAAALWCLRWQRLDGDRSAIRELAHVAESVFHGTPSGLDHGTVMAGGMVYFCDRAWEEHRPPERARLLIINTNMPRSTRVMVERVAAYARSHRSDFVAILERVSQLAEMALTISWEQFPLLLQVLAARPLALDADLTCVAGEPTTIATHWRVQ